MATLQKTATARRGYYSGRTLLDFFDLMNLRQFTSFTMLSVSLLRGG